MSDTVDPVNLLREVFVGGRRDSIVFDKETRELEFQKYEGTQSSVRVPVDWPTAWAKKDKSGYYTLGQLWFWLVNKDVAAGEYFKKIREYGIAVVPTGEREAITHFFTVPSATNLEELDERVRQDTLMKLSHLKAGRL